MSDWQLIEYDADLCRATWGRDVEGGMELKTEYYVDPTIEANKAEYNSARRGWAGDYHKVASLSPAIAYGDGYIAKALREGDDKVVSKWLNNSDNRAWRTKEGTV